MPELPSSDSKHPARLAAWRSIDAVARGDKQAWLDNFSEDAVVRDPIGKSIIDPSGKGFRGKEAISGFWDEYIAKGRPMFRLQASIVSGNECANVGTLMTQFENGMISSVYGVFTYRVNDEGKVTALRTYWEAEDMQMYPPLSERGA